MVLSPFSNKNKSCNIAKKYYCLSDFDGLNKLCQKYNDIDKSKKDVKYLKNYSYNNENRNIYLNKDNNNIIYNYSDNIDIQDLNRDINNNILLYDCNNKKITSNDDYLNNMCENCNYKNLIKDEKNTFDEIDMNIVNSINLRLGRSNKSKNKNKKIEKLEILKTPYRETPFLKESHSESNKLKEMCINFYESETFNEVVIITIIILVLLIIINKR